MLSYDELAAHRIQEMDYNTDEENIIRYLKSLLLEETDDIDEINLHLEGFYNYIGIDIDIDIINDVDEINPLDNQLNNNIVQIFTNIINNMNFPQNNIPQNNIPQNNDVIMTLNDEDYENLTVKKYNSTETNECTICMCDMEIDDEYYQLNCNHFFHRDCLDELLTNHDYKCPVCREEIGRSKANIDNNNINNNVNTFWNPFNNSYQNGSIIDFLNNINNDNIDNNTDID